MKLHIPKLLPVLPVFATLSEWSKELRLRRTGRFVRKGSNPLGRIFVLFGARCTNFLLIDSTFLTFSVDSSQNEKPVAVQLAHGGIPGPALL